MKHKPKKKKKKVKAVPRKRGRPSLFSKKIVEQVEKLCQLGATDPELAEFFGVNPDTIYEWKKKHKEFSEAIKRGKIIADSNVANSLYRRALGYEHDAIELKTVSLPDGGGSEIQEVKVVKKYPPDPTSAIFWLKNRRAGQWREKQEIDHTTKGKEIKSIPIEFIPKPKE